jgi:hypothetical protein
MVRRTTAGPHAASCWDVVWGPRHNRENIVAPDVNGIFKGDDAIVEVSLLLPGWEAAALERFARNRNLTVGQVLRSLIWDCLAGSPDLHSGGEREPAREFLSMKRAAWQRCHETAQAVSGFAHGRAADSCHSPETPS